MSSLIKINRPQSPLLTIFYRKILLEPGRKAENTKSKFSRWLNTKHAGFLFIFFLAHWEVFQMAHFHSKTQGAAVYSCPQRWSIVPVPMENCSLRHIRATQKIVSFIFFLAHWKVFWMAQYHPKPHRNIFVLVLCRENFHSFSFWHIGKFSSWLNCIQSPQKHP